MCIFWYAWWHGKLVKEMQTNVDSVTNAFGLLFILVIDKNYL